MVEDRDAAAAAAVGELYSTGIGTDHISRMLSLGLLGKKRKLVPTRWSITASDDMIGKLLKETILDKPPGERLLSLLRQKTWEITSRSCFLPRPFSFELVEIWMPRSVWAEEGFIGADREDARAKKEYSSLAGGYYAARLAVLEHLAGKDSQAGVLAVREISESLLGPAGGVGGAGGGQKGHALASDAVWQPGRGAGGDGEEDKDAGRRVAQGGKDLGRAGAEEPDGVLIGRA